MKDSFTCKGFSSAVCSSCMLMVVVVPLILISAFVCVMGPKTSTWASISYSPWLLNRAESSSSSINSSSTSRRDIDEKQEIQDLTNKTSKGTFYHLHDHHIDEAHLSADAAGTFSSSSSSTPHVAKDTSDHIHLNESKEQGLETSMNISDAVEAHVPESKRVIQKQYSKLQRLEAGLARARAAIREASQYNGDQARSDPDYVPVGPIYWKSHVFHRSYLEMEKQFKVFIYEEGEQPLFHSGPCKSIYSMEGDFIHHMEREHRFRTYNPDKAHVYFLPFSVAMMVRFVYVPNSHDITPIKQTVIDYVNVIGSKYPYWNRSLGADHFMLSCHDWGPLTSSYIPYMFKNSIRALCNANTSEGFVPSKDVSIPEINLKTGDTNGWIGGPSPSHRPILAFFAGGLHGPIRPVLLEHWENKDDDIQVYKYLPKKMSYHDMMKNSKYCICPSGYEVASPRIVEAIYAGCVPVLVSDNYVPPFSDVLNWKSFSVELTVSEIPNLKKILMGISQTQYIRMQRRGVQVRRHFEVNSPPKRFDVFHMILHSIWLRRLNVQIQDQ